MSGLVMKATQLKLKRSASCGQAPERVILHALSIWYIPRLTAPPILLSIDLVPRAEDARKGASLA